MASSYDKSKEKEEISVSVRSVEEGPVVDSGSSDGEHSRAIASRFGRLGPYMEKLFDLGVEAGGVERIPEDQRDDTHLWNKYLIFWSVIPDQS